MTLATKITLLRLLMAPLFVVLALAYGNGLKNGIPNELLRWAAICVFTLAAASDAVDGYIARHCNQSSRLGIFLDPIADKTLMLSAILTLSFTSWGQNLPLWYAALIIARDVIEISGAWPRQRTTRPRLRWGAWRKLKTSWITPIRVI